MLDEQSGQAGAPLSKGPHLTSGRGHWSRRRYFAFIVPALAVMLAVIVFPWLFTVFMSAHDWKIGQTHAFVGLDNYLALLADERFLASLLRTLYYGVLAVVVPLVLGVFSAVIFHKRFPWRGVLRGIFILPMMATPVAVALVWTMMFHPQLGVLNYLLSLIGLPPQSWVYAPATVIPTLVMVEVWQWTPLVMLITLAGLVSLPSDFYEAAQIDGATPWQVFWRITLPLVRPTIVAAAMLRFMDSVKTFDQIYVTTQGGPGVASQTLNLYVFDQAFQYLHFGYASALLVVLFFVILAGNVVLVSLRRGHA